jgi:choloylglycine hydrolase
MFEKRVNRSGAGLPGRPDPAAAARYAAFGLAACMLAAPSPAQACTYVRLFGADGSSHPGRTMEWGPFDLQMAAAFVPAELEMQSMEMPDGRAGLSWTTEHDFIGVSLLDKQIFGDAMNSEGLVVNLLYLPGFADYQEYDPDAAERSLSPN